MGGGELGSPHPCQSSPTAPLPLAGVNPQDRTIGTKNLTVEATDSISVLVHTAAREGKVGAWSGGGGGVSLPQPPT